MPDYRNPSNTQDRRRAYHKGKRAEFIAALYLRICGFRIVGRRFKTPVGEIDLIARRGDLVLFVEVKARKSEQVALDAISQTARQRIESAADWWLSRQSDAALLNWRFDVIAIVPQRWPAHFKDVW